MRRTKNKLFKQSFCIIGLIASVAVEADSSLNQSLNKHQETFQNAAMPIWNWAEVGYQEYKSSELLKAELAANGFTIQSGVADIPTAFIAEFSNGGPVIGILGEYDALPGLMQTASPFKESRDDVQKVRANYDAILTGGNTVINDSPRMNARVSFPVNQPKKILLSNKSNFDLTADFFVNCEYEILNETNIGKILERYRYTDITSILVEAGPKLVNAFLDSGKVDEVIIYQSQNNLGLDGVSWFKEDNAVEKLNFKLESSYKIESDSKKIYKNVKR